MKKVRLLSLVSSALLLIVEASAADFNKGWTFRYEGHAPEVVDLPHDAMIHGERRADVPGGNSVAYYSGALYIYEKSFDVPEEWLSKHVSFNFGGVYKEAKVYINDVLAGGYPYGYMPFTVNADGFLKKGENTIRVEADNEGQLSSRWYSGGGIYRPVEILVQNQIHIDNIKVKTLSVSPEARIAVKVNGTGSNAVIEILDGGKAIATAEGSNAEFTIPGANLWTAETPYLYKVKVTLKDDKGNVTDSRTENFGIRTLSWDAKGFYVNGKEVFLQGGCIHADNGIVGSQEYREAADRKVSMLKKYGYNAIRSAHNPASYELLEACDSLGMYVMDELWDMWFRQKNRNDYGKYFMDYYAKDLEAIVEKDYNHPSVIFYSIGNEISEPTAPGGLEITKDIVSRLHSLDPSRAVTGGMNTIILGSGAGGMRMGQSNNGGSSDDNSSTTPKKTRKVKKSKKASRIYVEPDMPEDGLVGFGDIFNKGDISSEEYNRLVEQHVITDDYMIMGRQLDSIITPVLDELDIVGYNYATVRYPSEEYRHPGRLIFGSETYVQDIWKNWEMVKEYPYVAGDFMWTAMDYLGECGVGAFSYGERRGYPYKLASVGALDLVGDPTGEAFLAKVTWEKTPGTPYIAVRPVTDIEPRRSQWRGTNSIPSWTWTGSEGKQATVEVYTSARKVKLYLNGKKVGTAKTEGGVALFNLPYEPGKLVAKACGFLKTYGESSLETATGEKSIKITPETESAKAGKVIFVRADAVGENGIVNTTYSDDLSISIEGGELLGFGSAQPITEASFDSGVYPAYYGRTLAAIRVGDSGTLKITVSGEGLSQESVSIPISR